jgi:hypothetical protein
MTGENFLYTMEGAFGPYLKIMRGSIADALKNRSGVYIDALAHYMLRNHDGQYKTPPGLKAIMDAENQVYDELEQTRIALENQRWQQAKAQYMLEHNEDTLTVNGETKTKGELLLSELLACLSRGESPKTSERLKEAERRILEGAI